MSSPPKLPSRRALIHFAAAMGQRYQLCGAEVCRLLRLVARYQSGKDEGAEFERLCDSIVNMFKTPGRPTIIFTSKDVFIGDLLVP